MVMVYFMIDGGNPVYIHFATTMQAHPQPPQHIHNPYDAVYLEQVGKIGSRCSLEEAKKLAVHLGLMYNTFGRAMKDVIRCLGDSLQSQSANDDSHCTFEPPSEVESRSR